MTRVAPIEPLEKRAYLAATFAAPVPLNVEQTNIELQSPVVGDFDKDGKLDLVIVDAFFTEENAAEDKVNPPAPATGRLAFAKGQENGTFTLGPSFSGGVFAGPAKSGDFDGDGNLDLVVANYGRMNGTVFTPGANINVLLGNGNGGFGAPISINVGQGPLPLAVADFNGDNRTDVAVGNRFSDSVTVLFGANSNSAPLANPVTLPAGPDPASLLVGDFNGDTRADLLVGRAGGAQGVLTVFPSNGNGTFGAGVDTSGPRGATAVGDFNKDGKLDLAVSISEAGTVNVLPGNGDGTFQVSNSADTGLPLIALVADYDGDGNLDVAAGFVRQNPSSDNSPTVAQVVSGNGNGTFQARQVLTGNNPGAGSVGDFNGDNKPDLAFASEPQRGQRVIDVFLNTTGEPNASGADLTAQVSGKLPPAVIAGSGKGQVSVKVTNSGNAAVNSTSPVTVTLFASTDGTVDGSDTNLGSKTVKRLRLKPNKAKTFKTRVNFPASIANGNYTILAQVDTNNGVAEANETNNTAPFATPVTIAAPFVDLAASFAEQPPATLTKGRNQSFTVLVQNNGNIAANGSVNVRVAASTTNAPGGQETEFVAQSRRVRINPGKSARIRLSGLVPDSLSGSRFVLASLTPEAPLTDTNAANNTVASSSQVTIS